MKPIDDLIHDIERAIASEGNNPEGGFPDAILKSAETLHISNGFVASCLDAVTLDRARIEYEASRVDEIHFPKEFLTAYDLPPVSADFVTRVQHGVQADRQDRKAQWRRLLRSYRIPEPSLDFVERTLKALTLTGSLSATGSLGATGPVSQSGGRKWGERIAAAAAAVLLSVGLNYLTLGADQLATDQPGTDQPTRSVSAQDYSPVPWGTALARRNQSGLRFEDIDGLQVLSLAKRAEDD